MKTYFKDQKLNQEFLENGFIKIKLFNNEEVRRIEKFGKKIKNQKKPHHDNVMSFNTNGADDLDYNSFFESLINQKIKDMLYGYEFLNATIANKPKRSQSLPWHYDLSIYDEEKFGRPISIWAGFKSTNSKNGNLILIPKSNKLALPLYPYAPNRNILISHLYDYKKLIQERALAIPLKKGEVIIHDQGIFHSSSPNRSFFRDRLAYKLLLIPSNVDKFSFSYFYEDEQTINVHEIPKEKMRNEVIKTLREFYSDQTKFPIFSKFKVSFSPEAKISNEKINEILETPINDIKPTKIISHYFSKILTS
ncbi:conserved protein of unknown function [Tenacibaculum sp. 190130A14a]|uniref:Phytanoyl-CoA dioxygenase n=1 Tax=Tenacibaculum polynesiense TaxID=3137857 RepID=A0ABP1F344_9FLAO